MSRILRLSIAIVLPVVLYSLIFMFLMLHEGQMENVNLVTAVYWVIITMTTVGYGELVFVSPAGMMFSVLVSISGIVIFFAVALPAVLIPWFERLGQSLPNKAPPEMKDHIIICGYNPIVETLSKIFERRDIPFVVVERSKEVVRSIYRKYPVVWGDPSEKEVLLNSNILSARLLIANEKDEMNADIALTAREISDLEVVALVEDLARSRFLAYAGASRIISPKTLLGTFVAQITSRPRKGVFPGAVKIFGGLLVEFPIHPGSPLIGKKVHDPILGETGAGVVGIWQKGKFVPTPGQEEIESHSVLMALGTSDSLTRLRALTTGKRREGPLIVIGYGDVGRRIVKVLSERGIEPTVIDKREVCSHQVVGDGTVEEVLEEAGVKDAVGVLVMLNNDTDVVFATLLARNLNRDAFIVARANRAISAEKIYRAGADYVASVPIVASHMLTKIAQSREEELTMIYEELELIRLQVRRWSGLDGKTLRKLDLLGRMECIVVAIERDGEGLLVVDRDMVLREGDLLAIIGSPESIEKFGRAYGGRFAFWKRFWDPRRISRRAR